MTSDNLAVLGIRNEMCFIRECGSPQAPRHDDVILEFDQDYQMDGTL